MRNKTSDHNSTFKEMSLGMICPGIRSLRDIRVWVEGHSVEVRSRIAQSYSFGGFPCDCPEERRETGGELKGTCSVKTLSDPFTFFFLLFFFF